MTINYGIDYYKFLGLNNNASSKEIKHAYYRLALKYHPDKNNNAKAQSIFNNIATSYEVLSNKDSKLDYDQNKISPSFAMFIDAITKNLTIDELKAYLDNGADINVCNDQQQNILMFFANRGNIEMVIFILQNNGSMHNLDIYENSPLVYAATKKTAIFKLNGIITEKHNNRVFNNEKEQFKQETTTKKEDSNDSEKKDINKQKQQPLKETSSETTKMPQGQDSENSLLEDNKIKIAELFINSGLDIKHANKFGDTPLKHSIASNFTKMAAMITTVINAPLLEQPPFTYNKNLEIDEILTGEDSLYT